MGWRPHDLPRTAATGLQRLGVRLEVTEQVLNHVSGSRAGIVGVYQRHDFVKQERDAKIEALWRPLLKEFGGQIPEPGAAALSSWNPITRVLVEAMRKADAVKSGAKWWPDRDFELKHIKPEQEARYAADPWHEEIARHLAGKDRVTVQQVARDALEINEKSRLGTRENNRIIGVLTSLKWTLKRSSGVRWYYRPKEPDRAAPRLAWTYRRRKCARSTMKSGGTMVEIGARGQDMTKAEKIERAIESRDLALSIFRRAALSPLDSAHSSLDFSRAAIVRDVLTELRVSAYRETQVIPN